MTPSSPGLHRLGLLLPSEWLPLVWGGEAPQFADESEAKAVLTGALARAPALSAACRCERSRRWD